MFIRRKIVTEEDRAKELARAREKQRKKMIKTKYGQMRSRHARKGIYSCCYAAVACLLLVLMVLISFKGKGDVGLLIGFVALGTLALSGAGLWLGIKGLKERDKNYITCKVGIGVNGVALFGLLAIYIRGIF